MKRHGPLLDPPATTTAEALQAVRVRTDTFPVLLQAVYDARYSGVVLLHCENGIPRTAEFPAQQIHLAPVREGGGS